jgi:hypothetical protein
VIADLFAARPRRIGAGLRASVSRAEESMLRPPSWNGSGTQSDDNDTIER